LIDSANSTLSATEPHPGSEDRVGLTRTLLYAVPAVGLAAPLFVVQFFFMKYGTDVLLLPPAVVALIFLVGRLWDAVSDPIAGSLSDRTRTRLGRRRPWLFSAIVPLALAALAIFSPPNLSRTLLAVWTAVAMFVFYTSFTAYAVPHTSLGAELSKDHHERSRLFGLVNASFTIGMIVAFASMQYVTNHALPREAARHVGIVLVGIVVSFLVVPPLFLRERSEYQRRESSHALDALKDVWRNPHARLILVAQFMQMVGGGALGILAPYLMQYVLLRPDLIGPMPAAFVAASVLSIPIWIGLSRRLGKARVWRVGLAGSALSFGCIALAGPGDTVFVAIVLVLAGFFYGCGGVVGPSLLADVIDWDDHQSGERREGIYSAAWGLALKCGNAVVILLTGIALQLSDFEPNVGQSAGTIMLLKSMTGLFPLVAMLAGAFVLRHFQLDEAAHRRIREELDRRAAQVS
jgi:GPH family glycoside/pentoside/hexuronide:cation symporter